MKSWEKRRSRWWSSSEINKFQKWHQKLRGNSSSEIKKFQKWHQKLRGNSERTVAFSKITHLKKSKIRHDKNTHKFRAYLMCTGVKRHAHDICTGFLSRALLYVQVLQSCTSLYAWLWNSMYPTSERYTPRKRRWQSVMVRQRGGARQW